jgi:diguanylate cyclase (GGDEF)-like protein
VLERLESDAQLKTQMNELASEVLIRKRAEEKIKHLANHDALTGLPSLCLGRDRLSSALASAKRRNSLAALMFIDLDGFKEVNDTLGHEAGDQVLIEIMKRLPECLRETDTVARIGGDEFLVVLTDVNTREDAGGVAKRILPCIGSRARVKTTLPLYQPVRNKTALN